MHNQHQKKIKNPLLNKHVAIIHQYYTSTTMDVGQGKC